MRQLRFIQTNSYSQIKPPRLRPQHLQKNLDKLNGSWVHTILRLESDGVKILMCVLGAL